MLHNVVTISTQEEREPGHGLLGVGHYANVVCLEEAPHAVRLPAVCEKDLGVPRPPHRGEGLTAHYPGRQAGDCAGRRGQVGGGRTVKEVAGELACDWHTVNDAVTTYGKALLEADRLAAQLTESLGGDQA